MSRKARRLTDSNQNAPVLAYHSRSWMLSLGALAPIPLLLLVRTSIFRIEFDRMLACQQVPLSKLRWGKQSEQSIRKDTEGPFGDVPLQTACATFLQAQLKGDGGMGDLLKTNKGHESELERRLKRLKEVKLGPKDLKASLKKAQAIVKAKSRKDYFGHPALNPSISDPFYHLLLTNKHIDDIIQWCFECRMTIAKNGDQKSVLAGIQLLEGILKVTTGGLIKHPPGKAHTARSQVLWKFNELLRVSVWWTCA
jgi:hypothetical protein